ncbi:hypothetical protein Q2T42_09540 [Leptolyngbya boryana CZ1]|uniref:Cytochrome c domain-containing protein n=1 Tax=Leptolyngbya boryana CZ1 TaxID=3060204 RepID=A0AA96WYZ0_LEPBY|nr:hypothetical protein [Leptolyngbya boryana]WNZ48072.1 hypothetical protein Q2T42_09540 [Leptolyngbya boryana CZ1]
MSSSNKLEPVESSPESSLESHPKRLPVRAIALLLSLIFFGFLGYQAELVLPMRPPNLSSTYTPVTQAPPSSLGSYDVLGHVVNPSDAEQLLQTEAGKEQLSPEQGAVEINQDLLTLGRDTFYRETFGNERFLTDVVGALDGPINLASITKAIVKLAGQPTTNLQVAVDRDVTLGGREFKAGTLLNTGLDIPARSLLPLGMRTELSQGKVRVGITCAFCHAAVDRQTGKILEGASNNDLDTGLILASASNSAAMFRHTGINPTQLQFGDRRYIDAQGNEAQLPDAKAVEEAVDADFLSWAPGNFDSTGTMTNNPSQNPSSYTFEAYPYGWSGHSAIGWFHGLTTLNSNVHATNSDTTTGADGSQASLGIDKETYLGILLQNASNPKFRLPNGANPAEFFDQIDPTPGEPAINEVIRMPGYPKGSPFMLDGLMASSPGLPIGQQLNAMSAWQNTLAPPPYSEAQNLQQLQQGAKVFDRAGCAECHSGRTFTNHRVISQQEVKTQPSRAPALKVFAKSFVAPKTYPNGESVPLPENPPVLPVPTDITPKSDQQRAFALNDSSGGYKVPSLIGLAVTAPYLHDGGVAASPEALQPDTTGTYQITQADQIGMAGTLMQHVLPDPAASLRMLVDRNLRKPMIEANRANADLVRSNIDGSGHNYWIDQPAGFTPEEQTAVIEFMLSLDDNPKVLPNK